MKPTIISLRLSVQCTTDRHSLCEKMKGLCKSLIIRIYEGLSSYPFLPISLIYIEETRYIYIVSIPNNQGYAWAAKGNHVPLSEKKKQLNLQCTKTGTNERWAQPPKRIYRNMRWNYQRLLHSGRRVVLEAEHGCEAAYAVVHGRSLSRRPH
jgi:hypothetical protein